MKPTENGSCLYYPRATEPGYNNGQPTAAIIEKVWTDTCVNLAYYHGHNLYRPTSVLVWSLGLERPTGGGYCIVTTPYIKPTPIPPAAQTVAGIEDPSPVQTDSVYPFPDPEPEPPAPAAQATWPYIGTHFATVGGGDFGGGGASGTWPPADVTPVRYYGNTTAEPAAADTVSGANPSDSGADTSASTD